MSGGASASVPAWLRHSAWRYATTAHLSCAVYYAREHDRLECPCHKGYFSVKNGAVLQGPPPRPLPRVALEQRGEDLLAVALETLEES